MKACFIYTVVFIILTIYGCVSSDKKFKEELSIKSKIDTSVLMNRIIETKKEIDFYKLSQINDSVQFYIYNIFHDEPIMSKGKEDFFCFYDLAPIYLDSTENSVVIRYNLLKKNSDNTFNQITNNVVDAEYKTTFSNSLFDKNKLSIVGKVYLIERLKFADLEKINEFLNKHNSKVNKWYREEIAKRVKK